jgi:preprotein translocase subunit SecE
VSDEGDAADDAASDGGETQDTAGSGGRTAVVTKPVTRPQRPTGKRSRQKLADAGADVEEVDKESTDEAEGAKEEKTGKAGKAGKATSAARASRASRAKKSTKAGTKVKKSKKAGASSANPIIFVYNYLKQVVAEMRKVIWPSRKQMLTYTSVVLVFLAFMVALVGLTDFGLAKLVLLVFG